MTDSDIQATMQTDVGQLLGTLPYMSPEQVAGDVLDLDTRSDVYALGVVLYELLAERLPYEVAGRALTEVARVIAEEEPASLRTPGRTLDADVELIVRKALEKERTRRYQSAAELAADLRRYLAHEPIEARAPTTIYQLRKFARRHVADEAAEPLFREALVVRRRLYGGEHPKVAESLSSLAVMFHHKGDYTRAERFHQDALDILRQVPNPDDTLVGRAQRDYGATLTALQRYEDAQEHLIAGHALLMAAFGEGHRRTQEATERLVELYEAWDKPAQAAQYRALIRERSR